MARRIKFPDGFHVIKVYVQPDEYVRLEKLCGESMSDWVRKILLRELEKGTIATDVISRIAAVAQENFERTSKAKSCRHGVKKGDHCWQCGGAAKIE